MDRVGIPVYSRLPKGERAGAMSIALMQAKVAIAAADQLGEGPAWDEAGQRLIWADHHHGTIHECMADSAGGWQEGRRWQLHRPLAATIPHAGGGLLVIGDVDIFRLDETGRITPFSRLDADPSRIRFNDAKCDPQGRLWAGTRTTDFREAEAILCRIDADGSITCVLEGLTLANGLDWSPDGKAFYLVDSLAQRVDAFDFDAAAGRLSNRRTLVMFDRGVPNGLSVDQQGCLWVAVTGAAEVQRYSPVGELLARVVIGTPGATSCAFGGAGCDELFITSRRGRMPDVALKFGLTPQMMENDGPEAGALFACRPRVRGSPAQPFGAY